MATSPDLPSLLAAAPPARAALAGEMLRAAPSWDAWREAFRTLHFERPEQEAEVASVLSAAAASQGEGALAARFRLNEARAFHRAGSLEHALGAYDAAQAGLRAAGLAFEAAAAGVMRVDALAVSGRVREALEAARAAGAALRGPKAAPWRAILEGNRANALRLLGDLPGALRAYAAAERRFRAQGNSYAAAIARLNAGVALMDGGDAEGARARFVAAAEALEAGGFADPALEARYNLACADVRAGRLGEGIAALARMAEQHDGRGLARRAALCRMDLAEALTRAGDRGAAKQEALRAAEGFAKAAAPAERAEALVCAAAAAAPREARRLLEEAGSAAASCGRQAVALRCRLLRAELGEAAGGAKRREVDLPALREEAERLGQHALAAEALLLEAGRALEGNQASEAAALLEDPRLTRPGRPWIRIAAESLRASAEAALGRPTEAIRRLRDVAQFLDAVHGGLPGAWLQATFLLRRMDPYLTLVDLLAERGRKQDGREAEALLDRLAARRFLAARPGALGGTPGLGRIRRRLEAIYDRLARGSEGERGVPAPVLPDLVEEARRLETEAADLLRKAERSRRAARGRRGAPGPAPRRETVVHVYPWGDAVQGLVVRDDGQWIQADLGDVEELEAALESLRFEGRRAAIPGAHSDGFARALQDLAHRYLEPLEPGAWNRRVRLIVDPRVPETPWEHLLDPSVSPARAPRLVRSPAARLRKVRRLPGEGTVLLAVGEPDLPAVHEEARRIAGLGPDVRVLAGSEATRAALLEALTTARNVHVAGHGFDAPEAPPLGGVRLADGWFTAADVPPRLAAEVVVLGACRTGRVSGTPGLAWGGLPTALLAAGAAYVVYTADDVEDRAAAAFLSELQRQLRTRPTPVAFGQALAAFRSRPEGRRTLLPFRLGGITP